MQVFVVLALLATTAFSGVVQRKFTPIFELKGMPTTRIISGTPAADAEFPAAGALLINGASFCGCALISTTWAVTAGHCTTGTSYQGVFGTNQWRTGTPIDAVQGVQHPAYDPNSLDNDIGLINFPAITLGPTIGVNTLNPEGSLIAVGDAGVVAGWGLTADGGSVSNDLNKAPIVFISDADCSAAYGFTFSSKIVCAFGRDSPEQGTCNGDSGSAVYGASGNQIALVSFGSSSGCQDPTYPKGQQEVAPHRPWILSVSGV